MLPHLILLDLITRIIFYEEHRSSPNGGKSNTRRTNKNFGPVLIPLKPWLSRTWEQNT
jgi:hypothetical protein